MSKRSIAALAVIAVAAFVGGLFTRPSEAQPKDERPALTAVGRYQAVPLAPGDFAVIDTSSGQAWQYRGNLSSWSNLGIPTKEAK
jgi:hypothetical protein